MDEMLRQYNNAAWWATLGPIELLLSKTSKVLVNCNIFVHTTYKRITITIHYVNLEKNFINISQVFHKRYNPVESMTSVFKTFPV